MTTILRILAFLPAIALITHALPSLLAESVPAGLADLTAAPEVAYRYIDANGNTIPASTYRDKTGRALIDGDADNQGSAVTPYRSLQDKTMRVLFEFPARVSPRGLRFVWKWGHNPKQWFDRARVYAGDAPGALNLVATHEHTVRLPANNVPIDIPLNNARGRFLLLVISQDAHAGHCMFGIGRVQVFGAQEDRDLLDSLRADKPLLAIERHYPANLFEPGETVRFHASVTFDHAATGFLSSTFTNYFGEIVERVRTPVALTTAAAAADIVVSGLDPGYYEMATTLTLDTAPAASAPPVTRTAKAVTSFGVAPFVQRTAAEALAAGNRFGIQENFSTDESAEAFTRLGLHWIRGLLAFGPQVGDLDHNPDWSRTDRFIDRWHVKRPGIMLCEIKSFPAGAYDASRYGATRPRDWAIGTLPLKEPYQRFVAAQLRRVPPEQRHFEIWNEPWDHYSPEDFATLSQWTLEAIRRVRPDAIVGPNLRMGTYLLRVIDAGGLDGMDMMTIHPYSPDFTSSPEKMGLRERIRSYHRLFREKLGHDLPLYVTEIGWPTPPEGPMSGNTEALQAAYMVRAALALYAEDVKAVTPYCSGQPERNRADKESYFGFVRKNQEPKPVLLAYANVARILEGTTFVGDVWIEENVGAMLFKKTLPDGSARRTLAVFADGRKRHILLRPDAEQVGLIDIMGRERTVSTAHNRLSLLVNDDPVFVTGVGPALEHAAISPGNPAARAVWTNTYRRATRAAPRIDLPAGSPLAFDAPQWDSVPPIEIADPRIPAKVASAALKCAWDERNLYFRFDIKDDSPGVNPADGVDIWKGDSIELFISADPESSVPGFVRRNDYQLLVTPFADSPSGNPKTVVVFGSPEQKGRKPKGVRTAFRTTADGWQAVIALPFDAIGVPSAARKPGAKLAMEAAIDNAGPAHPRYQINSNQRSDNHGNAALWSWLTLE